jgi:hypothetical protein
MQSVLQSGKRLQLVFGISTILLFAVPSPGSAQTIERSLQDKGYHMYDPPRANWGPGFVFAGDVIADKIWKVEEICPNLYGDLDAPNKTKVVLESHEYEDSLSFFSRL